MVSVRTLRRELTTIDNVSLIFIEESKRLSLTVKSNVLNPQSSKVVLFFMSKEVVRKIDVQDNGGNQMIGQCVVTSSTMRGTQR